MSLGIQHIIHEGVTMYSVSADQSRKHQYGKAAERSTSRKRVLEDKVHLDKVLCVTHRGSVGSPVRARDPAFLRAFLLVTSVVSHLTRSFSSLQKGRDNDWLKATAQFPGLIPFLLGSLP